MKSLYAALLALAGTIAAPPLSAQGQALDPDTVIDAIDETTLNRAITAIGATSAPLDDENNTVRIAYPNGMRGVARRMACSPENGCKGLILLGYFSKPDGVSEEQQQAALTRFGLEQNLASVMVNREGEHVVKSYIIFDGGITIDNLIVRIALFGESVKTYQELLYAD